MRHTCPRRVENFNKDINLDIWIPDSYTLDTGERVMFDTCNYCGSMSSNAFMHLLKVGWQLIPTDKTYKAYMAAPCKPYKLFEYDDEEIKFKQVDKFYFQHLAQEDRDELIRMYNDKEIIMGMPGYFYTTPFFAKRINTGVNA